MNIPIRRSAKVFATTGLFALFLGNHPNAQAPLKVLGVYDATDGGHAPMSEAGQPVLAKVADTSNFTLDYTSDKTTLNDTNLAKYDVLIVMNYYAFNMPTDQRNAIQKFVEAGKGWILVHATACDAGSWSWLESQVLGGTSWQGHDNLREGTLVFENRTYPITKNMPASTMLLEEWYNFTADPRPNVNVLAKAGSTNDANYDNTDHPIIWYSKTYSKVVYISAGHDKSDWTNPDYVQLMHDAILYAGPTTTQIRQQAYLGAPVSGAWIQDGVLHVGSVLTGLQNLNAFRLTDAGGHRLSIVPSGSSEFKIADKPPRGIYFLSSHGLHSAMPVLWNP